MNKLEYNIESVDISDISFSVKSTFMDYGLNNFLLFWFLIFWLGFGFSGTRQYFIFGFVLCLFFRHTQNLPHFDIHATTPFVAQNVILRPKIWAYLF
jgi:hypothetical protein